MIVEEKFPESFKRHAYHPSYFVYAWKRRNLEKLFEEIIQFNIAIESCEAWMLEKEQVLTLIPLKSGEIKVYFWKVEQLDDEEWFDFVERSAVETLAVVENWNLEKTARVDLSNKIYYHFKFKEG